MAADVVDAQGTPGTLAPPQPFPAVEGYEVRQQLAATQASDVFLAVHTASGALRTLAVQRFESEEPAVRRMVGEVLEAGRVKHPRVALVDGVGTTRDGRLYVATAYVEGITLGQLLAAEGHLPARRALHIGLRAAEALEAAHRVGVTHGELTPEQIIVGPVGADGIDTVTVTGFGMSAEHRLVPTKADRPYASPERMQGGTVDARSDVFSLASVILHVLSGNAPPPPRPSSGRGVTPTSTAAVRPGERLAPTQVLLTARAAEPARRYQSTTAFREALSLAFGSEEGRRTPDAALGGARVPTPTAAAAAPTPAPTARPAAPAPARSQPAPAAASAPAPAPAPRVRSSSILAAPFADLPFAEDGGSSTGPAAADAVAPPTTPPAVPPELAAPAASTTFVSRATPLLGTATVPPLATLGGGMALEPIIPDAVEIEPAEAAPPALAIESTVTPAPTPPAAPVIAPPAATFTAAPMTAPIFEPAAPQQVDIIGSGYPSLGRPTMSEPLFAAPVDEPAAPVSGLMDSSSLLAGPMDGVLSAPAASSSPGSGLTFLTPASGPAWTSPSPAPAPRRAPQESAQPTPAPARRVWMLGGVAATIVAVATVLMRPPARPDGVPAAPAGQTAPAAVATVADAPPGAPTAAPPAAPAGGAVLPAAGRRGATRQPGTSVLPGEAPAAAVAEPPAVATPAVPRVVVPDVAVRPSSSPSDTRLALGALSEVAGSTKAGDVERATRAAEPVTVDAATRGAINATVARFARALEARDIGALKQVYPGLTMTERETWTSFFRSSDRVRAQFAAQNFTATTGGVDADAVGKLTFYKRDARQAMQNPVRFRALFTRTGSGWVMKTIH